MLTFALKENQEEGAWKTAKKKKPEFSKVGKTDRTPLYSTQQRGDTVTRLALAQWEWVKGFLILYLNFFQL